MMIENRMRDGFLINNQQSTISNILRAHHRLNLAPDECVRGYVFAVNC